MHFKSFWLSCMLLLFNSVAYTQLAYTPSKVEDNAFWQEYHVPHPISGIQGAEDIRSVVTEADGTIWIATAAGIFSKKNNDLQWKKLVDKENDGPAYALLKTADDNLWAGTWKGVYLLRNKQLQKAGNTEGPVSVLCSSTEGVYAFEPKGIWLCSNKNAVKQHYNIARSVRSAISDNNGGLWLATDVGLYHCSKGEAINYHDTNVLPSAYTRGLVFDHKQQLWVAGMGGVGILHKGVPVKQLKPADGIPSIYTNCIALAPDSSIWIGTDVGVVRFHTNETHSLRFTRRWLLNDKVNSIHFDQQGTAWIATANGLSAIHKKQMTLADKERFFYNITMQRHVREPWIVGQCKLPDPTDLTKWEPEDDDNDGEYGGNYLAMESFRYATTKDPDAKAKAKKAFDFLKQLQEITGLDGFFARTIVPASWGNNVHDNNRTYTAIELAEEMVKEPRFKPVETRWHPSKDGKWLWKGDTSSDEWCGHMMGYFFYYELVADKKEKQVIAAHVAKLVDHLVSNNFNMIDKDGTHTRWSVWNPDQLNRDHEWMPDRNQNSMEVLAFLKLAHYMTGAQKYQDHYLHLIREEGYLENLKKIKDQNPGWFIYFDAILQLYLYPILLHCEKDPELKSLYETHFDNWMQVRKKDESPLINFFYCYARKRTTELQPSVDFLRDTPLDLVNWGVDHTKREDIQIVRTPVMDDMQVSKLPPASIRAVIRWDKNPWAAVNRQTNMEREPVFWLLPYWMGRYLKMIE